MGTWFNLDRWKADSPIVQSLTAVSIWPTLTAHQRVIVAGCRETVDPDAEGIAKYRVLIDGLVSESGRTLASLAAKGVVDERGCLTDVGVYTALWNQLDRDKQRRERRKARANWRAHIARQEVMPNA